MSNISTLNHASSVHWHSLVKKAIDANPGLPSHDLANAILVSLTPDIRDFYRDCVAAYVQIRGEAYPAALPALGQIVEAIQKTHFIPQIEAAPVAAPVQNDT